MWQQWLAAWVPTDGARALARVIRDAIDATMTRTEASACMRLNNEALLSEQLNCQKPLNIFRLGEMPAKFWDVCLEKLAEQQDGLYLTPGTVVVLRGAAAMSGRKRGMARMTPVRKESRQLA